MIENREQLIEKINGVKNARIQKNVIYEVLDELGISYKRTNCSRCLNDLLSIAKEELGLIDNAAEVSSFNDNPNKCYRYILKRSQVFEGYLINNDTPIDVIRKFIIKHPVGYFEETPCEEVPSFEEKDSVPEQTTETEEVADEQTEIQEKLENK